MTIPIPLQEALRDSITSGSFVDTKFWVFSKCRSNTGRVGCPKPLFVNAHVAKRVPRLNALLDGCKNKENLRTRFPANRKPYTSNYDYEDDSDLEEDDDDDIPDNETAVPSQIAMEKSGNNSSDFVSVAINNPDGNSDGSSDIISVSDLDSLFSESPDAKDETMLAHVGKVLVIEDVAFVTFQALLRYLYTNEIEFAPWGSAGRHKTRALETEPEAYGIPRPSPKSIYRLADKYDIPELKELALGQIQRDLSECDIVEEVFSKYTSWYPELRQLEIRQLASTLLSVGSDNALWSLKATIERYTHGELPHAKHIISALYALMESDESVEIPLPVAMSSNQHTPNDDWAGLKKALTSSLTSGTFLDSQFYAVESKSSTGLPRIRPVYFCSMVDGGFMSKLMTCSSKLKGWKAPARFTDGYESDIGEEEPGSEDCYPRSKCVRESPARSDLSLDPALLLNYGAVKTWSAVFLYVYTGQVKFATIDSQGATSKEMQNGGHSNDEAKPSQDQEEPGAPLPGVIVVEPCSPKSIYSLANKVGLNGLRSAAFKDIESKINEKNIIEELFCPFTANHEIVREMEHELFQSKLKPLVDRTLISDVFENSSTGEHLHRTVAMGLILERSIQDRRKRTSEKAKNASQPDSTSQPEQSTETPTAPIPQVQNFVPEPTPQPQPQTSRSGSTLASASTKTEAPSTLLEPRKKIDAGPQEEPPINAETNPSCEHTVKLACSSCGAMAVGFLFRYWAHTCHHSASPLKCTGCGTKTVGNTIACTACHGKFK